MKIPKGKSVIVVAYHGKTRKLSSVNKKIREKLYSGQIVARMGVKIGNKIEWV